MFLGNHKTYRKIVLNIKCVVFLYICSKHFSPPHILSYTCMSSYKSSLSLSDLFQNWYVLTHFNQTPKYRIS
jgi:hypothetical protein